MEGPIDPNLRDVIQRWPNLPEATRAGILAMVQGPTLAAKEGKTIMDRHCSYDDDLL